MPSGVCVSRRFASHVEGLIPRVYTKVMQKAVNSSVRKDREVLIRGGGVASMPTIGPVKPDEAVK